jgi:hypothetical protein
MNINRPLLILPLALGLQLSVELDPLAVQAKPSATLAQSPKPPTTGIPNSQKPRRTKLKLPKPPVVGIPDRRKPAGTRGSCQETALPLTPILPNPQPNFSGLTLSSHPTFWFYIPYQSDRVKSGRFSLETERDGIRVWHGTLKLPATPGFVSVTLPPTAKGLEEGKTYRWHFILYCNDEDEAEPSFVFHNGLVKRARNSDFPAAYQPNLLAFYLNNQLWYDAASRLGEIRQSPQQWNSFLAALDMSAYRQERVSGTAATSP